MFFDSIILEFLSEVVVGCLPSAALNLVREHQKIIFMDEPAGICGKDLWLIFAVDDFLVGSDETLNN